MKDKILASIFLATLSTISISFLFLENREMSFFERRKLTTKEELKKDFLDNVDDYMTDQFVKRDSFLALNSFYRRNLLLNGEYNDAYIYEDYIIEKNYPLDWKNVDAFIKKIKKIKNEYLEESNVFYSIIPDKAYFLDENVLTIDYKALASRITGQLDINYIDIFDKLKLDDYFKTDIHIKQESYFKIVNYLSRYLDFKYEDRNYTKKSYADFRGSSYSKIPHPSRRDTLNYYIDKNIENAKVEHLEHKTNRIYNEEKLGSVDSYDVFLNGPSSLLTIENPNAPEKELIIFRDSFASSLTPLLLPYYKKITLIDLRYGDIEKMEPLVDFKKADVIFLYSTLTINNAHLLKVKI